MSTGVIAELTGKRHADVLRGTRAMLAALKLRDRSFASTYLVGLRYRITGRRLELEAQAAASWFGRSLAARQLVPLTRP
jgi:hypothetical protein